MTELMHETEWRRGFTFRNNVSEIVFIPYAKVNGDYDGYTKMMADAIGNIGKNLIYIETQKYSTKSELFIKKQVSGRLSKGFIHSPTQLKLLRPLNAFTLAVAIVSCYWKHCTRKIWLMSSENESWKKVWLIWGPALDRMSLLVPFKHRMICPLPTHQRKISLYSCSYNEHNSIRRVP